jgi:hypothetical protein
MKYLTIIIILSSLLLLPSCGKKVMVKGLVYNPVTGEGIPGIDVVVTRAKFTLGYDGGGYKVIYATKTNANGNFTIEERFRRSKNYKLTYSGDPDKYYQIRSEVDDIGAHTDGAELTYPLIPRGGLAKNTVNIACFDENDQFTIDSYHRSIPDYGGNATYFGCFQHYGTENFVPMGWHVYIGTVTKNGITTPFADSIYVTEGGSHEWNIEY